MIELCWRLTLFCACLGLAVFLGSSLYNQSELEQAAKGRMALLKLKKERLENSFAQKRAWLSSGKKIEAAEIASELCEMPLCTSRVDQLMQNAYHPFLKDSAAVNSLLDRLDQNLIELREEEGSYSLVRPVYMEEKDLEKMIEIIENKGAFSPVEIKELDFKKESLLGGELWRVEHLVFGRVDADGALP